MKPVNTIKSPNLREGQSHSPTSVDNQSSGEAIDIGFGSISEFIGESSEVHGENSSGAKSVSSDDTNKQKGATTKAINDFHLRILSQIPSKRTQIQAQIVREINREIALLNKEANRIMKASQVNYFELNNVLRKVRDLKEVLSSLVKASYENLKALWLKFVHGIM